MLYHERSARKRGYSIIVGLDEAGRGPLAGPVVVAAVFLETFRFKNRIDDSKKLSKLQRERAFYEIAAHAKFGVGMMNEGAIDMLNVSRATGLAADIAVSRLLGILKKKPALLKKTFLLRDGALRTNLPYASKEIIGGDEKSLSIAAASIVAKVIRDRIMEVYDKIYTRYRFAVHKGYGTKDHRARIARFGLSPIHRKTFCHSGRRA